MVNDQPEYNPRTYLFLFLALIGMIAILPQAPESRQAVGIGLTLSHTLVVLIGAFVITKNRVSAIMLIAGLGLTYLVIGIALSMAGRFNADADIQANLLILEFILILPFYLALIIKVSQRIMRGSTHTRDRMLAAICLYLVLGITYAVAHALLWHLDHDAFKFTEGYDPISFDRFGDFLYYSFVTITTLGYGDITPSSRIAKSLAILEAITGTLYIVLVISRLAALYNPLQQKQQTPSE